MVADQKRVPDPFKAGAMSLSAQSLNDIRNAILRQITGGAGIVVEKFDNRVVIRLASTTQSAPGDVAIVTITELRDKYLICDKDGATIPVAKPYGLRKDAEWPTGPEYTYDGASTRTAVQDGYSDETQKITPDYQVGEELLVVRVPSARLLDDDNILILWMDMNVGGRTWAEV